MDLTKKSTWAWNKEILKGFATTYYTCNYWKIDIYAKYYFDKQYKHNKCDRKIIVYYKDKAFDLTRKWGNTFTHVSQIKKYVEHYLSKQI